MELLESIPSAWLPASVSAAAVGGADEVGRGALTGPLVLALVALPDGWSPIGLRDSKLVSPSRRAQIAAQITERAEHWIEEIAPAEIDRLGIGGANRLGFERLLARAALPFTLIDGNLRLASELPHRCVVRGERFAPVAAASILAKCHRDQLMRELDEALPGRGFASAGYPTQANIAAIREHGRTEWHRTSFRLAALGEKCRPAEGKIRSR